MCDKDQLASQLLELSKQLASSNKSFHLTLKTKDITFNFSSKDGDLPLLAEKKTRKKSPSQKNRDFQRRKTFLEKKSNFSEKSPEENSTLEESNDATNFLCVKCDSTFKSEVTLNKHVNTKHPEKVLHMDETKCKICGKIFVSTFEIIKHMNEHMEQNQKILPFTCKLCGLGLEHDREIKNHMINHVERVLAEDEKAKKSENELISKLAAIEESEENTDSEDFTEEQAVAIADAYLAKCDADGNYIG